MLKKKITSAILVFMLAAPLALLSTSASAHHKYGHYSSCDCKWRSGMPLVYKVVKQLRASPTTHDQAIYVSARGHQVELSGYVGTASQKRVALDIARYTCGVSVVWDNLRLQAP